MSEAVSTAEFWASLAEATDPTAYKPARNEAVVVSRLEAWDAPYYVLKALLAEDESDSQTRDESLEQAFNSFDPVSVLEEWEMYWYRKAAIMAKDDEKLNEIRDEERKRKRAGKEVPLDDSLLPAIKAGGLMEAD